MFKRLHLKLTCFCTLVCGLILVIMSLVCLSFSEVESRKSHFADFQKNINIFIRHLESESVISYNWLSQFQTDTHFEMNIKDNGSRLVYETLNPASPKEEVFDKTRSIAQEQYGLVENSVSAGSLISSHTEFIFTSSTKQDYYAAVALIPKNGGILNVAVLCPLKGLYRELSLRRRLFLAVDVLGFLLLGIFFWIFTGYMIKPLMENRRKQTEFIAAASHELRSPLTVIRSCLSSLKHASLEEAAHFSQLMEQESRRMSRLIDDMLTLSNADSSHFSIHRQPTELDTLLLSAYEKFELLARQRQISLSIALPEKALAPCLCDPERIAQVLSILLDNALCYTPAGGSIRLALEQHPGKVLMRVTDTGTGIPDSEKEAVFDRFYRCDKSHKDKEHFGLGLCIARELIRMHHGKLWIEDTPGGGASFVIQLRMQPPANTFGKMQ